MAVQVGELVFKMAADIARLQTDMQKARGTVDSAMQGMKGAASIAKTALAGVGVARHGEDAARRGGGAPRRAARGRCGAVRGGRGARVRAQLEMVGVGDPTMSFAPLGRSKISVPLPDRHWRRHRRCRQRRIRRHRCRRQVLQRDLPAAGRGAAA
jgi:hypothetical protein